MELKNFQINQKIASLALFCEPSQLQLKVTPNQRDLWGESYYGVYYWSVFPDVNSRQKVCSAYLLFAARMSVSCLESLSWSWRTPKGKHGTAQVSKRQKLASVPPFFIALLFFSVLVLSHPSKVLWLFFSKKSRMMIAPSAERTTAAHGWSLASSRCSSHLFRKLTSVEFELPKRAHSIT